MLVQCAYICTYTCVSECAHVDMYADNLGYFSSSEKQSSDAMHFAFWDSLSLVMGSSIGLGWQVSLWTTRIFSSLHWDYKFTTINGIFHGFWVSDLGPQYCKKRALLTWATSPILCFFREIDVLLHFHKVSPKIQFLLIIELRLSVLRVCPSQSLVM